MLFEILFIASWPLDIGVVSLPPLAWRELLEYCFGAQAHSIITAHFLNAQVQLS